MNAAEFASRLDRAKLLANGKWQARCPAHDDHSPSLGIWDGDRGVVLKCMTGCTTEEIVAALGMKTAELFFDPLPQPARTQIPRLGEERVTAMASALEADPEAWKHLVDTLRLGPGVLKSNQVGLLIHAGRRWIAYPYQRRGEWTVANCRTLDGDRAFRREPAGQETSLYLGDALRDGGVAVLTEGEKDSLAALTMGLQAELGGDEGAAVVGLPGASQAKLAIGALMNQRRVYVALDADDAGDKCAAQVISALGNRAVRLRPPGRKDFGDLLAAEGPERALAMVLEVARQAEETIDTGSSRRRIERYVRGDYEPPPLIPTGINALDKALNGGIPLNKLAVIAARTSHGKSATAVRLAVNMAQNERPVRVIWCEDEPVEFDLRALAIMAGTALPEVLDAYRAKQIARIWDRVPGVKRDKWGRFCRTITLDRPDPQAVVDLIEAESGSVFLMDHLGEIDWGVGRKHELIGDGLRLIRAAALRSKSLFVAMTQLNRDWDRRKAASDNPDDVKPCLSDIENSGQIEQVARVCVIAEKRMTMQADGEYETGEYCYHVFKPRIATARCAWRSDIASPDNPDPVKLSPLPPTTPAEVIVRARSERPPQVPMRPWNEREDDA